LIAAPVYSIAGLAKNIDILEHSILQEHQYRGDADHLSFVLSHPSLHHFITRMKFMIRITTLRAMTIILAMSLSGIDVMAQKRISFRRGSSSATVRGKIGAKGYLEYLINGRAGQLLTIDITSGNGAVLVNAGSASGKNFSIEMTGGDHQLSIVNQGSATNYTLKVSIK
jgi:hypothetical protein